MSVIRTGFQRGCDGCDAIHPIVCTTPRRALAAARRDGWQRRNLSPWLTREDGSRYQHWVPLSDLCPECLDRLDEGNEEE